MKLGITSDHRGYNLKQELIEKIAKDYEIIDYGCNSSESVDYPDYAFKISKAVIDKEIDFDRNNCTFVVAVKPDSKSSENTIWSTRTKKEDTLGLRYGSNVTNKITLIQSLLAVSGYTFSPKYESVNANQYITVIFDNGTLKCYFDGELVQSTNLSITMTNTVTNKFSLGCFNNNGSLSGYFQGTLFSYRLYNRALTDLEVKQIYTYDKEKYEVGSE